MRAAFYLTKLSIKLIIGDDNIKPYNKELNAILDKIEESAYLRFNEDNNLKALQSLIDLKNELLNQTKKINEFNYSHYNYLINLLMIKNSIDKKNYIETCWEIGSMVQRFNILQSGLKENIIYLISKVIKEEINECINKGNSQ